MSNQDSDDRKPFGRLSQMMSKTSDESGYKTPLKKDSDDQSPVISGRGRFLALAVSFLTLIPTIGFFFA